MPRNFLIIEMSSQKLNSTPLVPCIKTNFHICIYCCWQIESHFFTC